MSRVVKSPVALPKDVLKQLWEQQLYGMRNAEPLVVADHCFAPGEIQLVTVIARLIDGLYQGHVVFSNAPDNSEQPGPRGDLSCLQPYVSPPLTNH